MENLEGNQQLAKKPRLTLEEDEDSKRQSEINDTPANKKETSDTPANKKETNCHVLHSDTEQPVCERDVGITEYVSKHEGFQGIIKHRFSDFLVNEIGLDGKKVCLTDISCPAEQSDNQKVEELSSEDILSEEDLKALKDLDERETSGDTIKIAASDDKAQRTLIHSLIKRLFPKLESTTSDCGNQKVIVVTKSKATQGASSRRRQERWPYPGTDYCHCHLYKENLDTMEAVNTLSKLLHIKSSMIAYAGTKDRRAKTCQKLSLYRITASRLHSLNKRLRSMTLGNFRYAKDTMRLGDLKGNHFAIVLRSVTGSLEQIQQAMSSLETAGFINYFGMQRFGTSAVPTHLVGRSLLQSNWQEAIELIMKPRSGTNLQISSARKEWWESRDAAKALNLLGNQQCPERHLLTGLKSRPDTDFVGALGFIPRNQRTMYVHAYQSYVWNRMNSHRYQTYGLSPVVGDLVIKRQDTPDSDQTLGVDKQDKKVTQPTVVSANNVSEFSIEDVVLPLPGYDVLYPENSTGQMFHRLLAEDGLTVDDLRHKVKDYSLRGQYRHIVVHPANFTWELVRYDNGNEPLILSDQDKLNELQTPQGKPDGNHQALKLEFSLPSSTYATMALREVLKQDTSAASQSMLTAACNAN